MDTQKQEVLAVLNNGNSITPLEALNWFGCFRLGGRINDLRNDGVDIHTELITRNGKTFARYWLKSVYDKRRERQQDEAEAFCAKVFV